MSRYQIITLAGMLFFAPWPAWTQVTVPGAFSFRETLGWQPVRTIETAPGERVHLLTFSGSVMTDDAGMSPVFFRRVPVSDVRVSVDTVFLSEVVYQSVSPYEILALGDVERIQASVKVTARIITERKEHFLEMTIVPFRRDGENGNIEKVISFEMTCILSRVDANPFNFSSIAYAEHSVLATGSWYKFSVSNGGIYRLTYEDLASAGVNLSGLDPRTIKIYGNGSGALPESNMSLRQDDLREISIQVVGEEDGIFNPVDYILFYGESQDTWKYNGSDGLFHHRRNIYSDNTFYFLTVGGGYGRRLLPEPGTSQPVTHTITRFNAFAYYERDDINLIKSGREWFDQEYFDATTKRNYTFAFPDPDPGTPAYVTARVAARSTSGTSSFNVTVNGHSLMNIPIQPVSGDFLATYAREKIATSPITLSQPAMDVQLTYDKPVISAIGYLNYLEINVRRQLNFSGGQLMFRSAESAGSGNISEFRLNTQGQQLQVWDVTKSDSVLSVQTSSTGSARTFRLHTDTLREFLAFDGSGFLHPDFVERVENQDLHGVGKCDYVIVSHPAFLPEAERLAQFHREKNGLTVFTTTPQTIFNEFSSGAQDLSAIRDFMRMLYERASAGAEPRYLLLFGDASFDYKNREENNTNFVLAYESPESLDPVDSYVTDDYFVLLDPDEGQGTGGSLDLGVGRLPVASLREATEAVDKILHYCSESDSVKNDWRNVVSFVADDGDGNLHLDQVEALTNLVITEHPVYNVDKIYLDAYMQIATPGGQRCPEVNDAINKRMDKGALIISYTGHGGELGWAHERVLEVPDIKSWTNFDNMPVFVTATCEFSRYDDPGRISAGEWVFLNPDGGGIALFTTTRPTFAGSNFALAMNFFSIAFERIDGNYQKLGDLIMASKNSTSSSANTRKFVLLGDPALAMAYPGQKVVTTNISSDTLMALSEVTITGQVQYDDGTPATDFNGLVFPTVFDKKSEIRTLGNDGDDPVDFFVQKNQIYKGQVQVTDGEFSFSFIVPKDIAYMFGTGKISYYARNPGSDAHGFDTSLQVGGYDPDAIKDENGPELALYMNDAGFRYGGITDQNPVLVAFITDESGINTVGNGIGHDITAVLDMDSRDPQILNDYYVADLDTYQSGWIRYPYFNLSEGWHAITLKVWDVFNNSSEETIRFMVRNSAEYVMERAGNHPNPFSEKTTFSFQTNQTDQFAEVEIRIYTVYGKLVRTLRSNRYITGYLVEPMEWDGTADGGWKAASGTYVYRVTINLADGHVMSGTGKLVMIR